MGDTHCGHRAGMTPPEWWEPEGGRFGPLQREMWGHYEHFINKYSGPDVLMFLGDAIDGKGQASGGTEQITTDRQVQAEMAAYTIAQMSPERVAMVYGTSYHTGREEDWEMIVCVLLNDKYHIPTEIHGWIYVRVEDVTFHLKHRVGSTSRPHTVHTSPAGEALGVKMWESEYRDWPEADIIVRGHRHKMSRSWTPELGDAIVLPALQAAHTKYGARQCMGVVHWGVWPCTIDGTKYSLDDPGPDYIKLHGIKPAIMEVE
jgi:hypothetical protein